MTKDGPTGWPQSEGMESSAPAADPDQDHKAGHSSKTPACTAEPASDAQLTPRVFVISQSGRCAEFLRPGIFEAYTDQYRDFPGVTELQSTHGSVTIHRFVQHLAPTPPEPAPLPVSEGRQGQAPEPLRALQALQVPKKLYPTASTGIALPRIAAARPAHFDGLALPPVLLMREFLVYDVPSEEQVAIFATAHQDAGAEAATFAAAEAQEEVCPLPLRKLPTSAKHSDRQGTVRYVCYGTAAAAFARPAASCETSFCQQSPRALQEGEVADATQQALLQRLTQLEAAAAARSLTAAAFERATAQTQAAERVAAQEAADAQAAAERAAGIKAYKPWQPPVDEFDVCCQAPEPGKVLRYFDAEEGKRALQTQPSLQSAHAASIGSNALLPRPADSAAATAFKTPGVYTSADAHAARSSLEAGSQSMQPWDAPAWSPLRSTQRSTARRGASSPQHSPGRSSSPQRTWRSISKPEDLPHVHSAGATAELNIANLQREYEAMRLTSTSSAMQVRARGRDGAEFTLGCKRLDFGQVTRGASVTRKLPLQNVSLAAARFSIDQTGPQVRAVHAHKPVPAGLKAHADVTFTANADAALGEWSGEVVVRSAFNVLRCPASAEVVEAPQPAANVQEQE